MKNTPSVTKDKLEMEKQIAHNQRTIFLKLPLDLVCYFMKFLNFKQSYELALCYVLASYLDGKKRRAVLPFFEPNHFKILFNTVNKLNKIISAPGFYYDEEEGVFAWGDNRFGLLGLGHKDYQNSPQLIPAFKNKELICISKGYFHTLFLTQTNELYTCGKNLAHLGVGDDSCTIPKMVPLPQNVKIRAVAAGGAHSLVLTEDYKVYSSGHPYAAGQCHDYSSLRLIEGLADKKIIAIAAGYRHSLFLSDCHEVYSCGINDFGELGIINSNANSHYHFSPQKVTALSGLRITTIGAGERYSLVLTDKLEVYAFGKNKATGLPCESDLVLPQLIPGFKNKKIIAFSAGLKHALYLTDDYKVYSYGNPSYSQSDIECLEHLNIEKNDTQIAPLEVSCKKQNIRAIYAGENFSQLITDKRKVYITGEDSACLQNMEQDYNGCKPVQLFFPNPHIEPPENNTDSFVNLRL